MTTSGNALATIPAAAPLTTLRASALPLGFKCPGSLRAGTVEIDDSGEAANLGTAAHEALRPLAEGGAVQWDSLAEIALRWNVSPDDLRMVCAIAGKLWPTVKDSFRDALTEVSLSAEIGEGVTLTGHVDLLAVSGTVARAGDWKTGRKDGDYSHQMRAYGALVLLDDGALTEVTITVLWVRDGEIENYTMARADAKRWLDELRHRVIYWDGVYHPGAHCGFCPRSHECAAANAMVRRDIAAMLDSAGACALAEMAPAEVIALYRKASLVFKYADGVRHAIKAHVEATGDVITEDGRLTISEEQRRELLTLSAWPVLEAEGFADEDFATVVDISVSRVEKLVATKAGRGKGAAAVRALGTKLEDAGAIKRYAVRKLTEKR